MPAEQSVNLDTSVLLNYVYATLPGEIEADRGSTQLVDSAAYHCVVGVKASEEFDASCERRFDLYGDLLDWLAENPDASIYEYDPTARPVRTSSNDIAHIRLDVQHGWGEEPRQKQLSDIRRCQQELGVFQHRLPTELLDRVYESLPDNRPLLEALSGLDLAHDRAIIVDAVEICREDDIDVLVSLDSDITAPDQVDAIRDVIRETEGEALLIDIVEPRGVLG